MTQSDSYFKEKAIEKQILPIPKKKATLKIEEKDTHSIHARLWFILKLSLPAMLSATIF